MTKQISENKMYGGTQYVFEHESEANGCAMRVGVFMPPQAKAGAKLPALIYLSGLTCTEQNFVTKGYAQKLAAELGVIIVAPDTSPRGDDVPDTEDQYDFGKGAGFYLDATQKPWAKNFNMETYITRELTEWMKADPCLDPERIGIFGHSMGGHGALTLHLKNPELFKTCSAFAPIVAPSQVPWGQKALSGYLGDDKETWMAYDATALVEQSPSKAHILIDQGTGDQFLTEHLRPELFKAACMAAGQKLTLRMQEGYDHSYYFMASFMEDHIRHHMDTL